jgi:hypothetical protein
MKAHNQGVVVAKGGLEAFIAELGKFLDAHISLISADAPALTGAAKARATRLRLGGEKAVSVIAALVTQHGLESSQLSASTMTGQLTRATSLVPTHKRLEQLTKRMGDEIFVAQSTSWEQATSGYAQLQRLAKKNGEIATALAPVQQYFARRHKSVTEEVTGVDPAASPKPKTGKKAKATARLEKAAQEAAALNASSTATAATAAPVATTTPAPTSAPVVNPALAAVAAPTA